MNHRASSLSGTGPDNAANTTKSTVYLAQTNRAQLLIEMIRRPVTKTFHFSFCTLQNSTNSDKSIPFLSQQIERRVKSLRAVVYCGQAFPENTANSSVLLALITRWRVNLFCVFLLKPAKLICHCTFSDEMVRNIATTIRKGRQRATNGDNKCCRFGFFVFDFC